MDNYVIVNGELYHYGVPGMKWGHRKQSAVDKARQNMIDAKKRKRTAKKEYNKSFSKAYDRSIAAWSPVKKHRQANDARWEDAMNKAETSRNATAKYKKAKQKYKAEKAAQKALAKIEKQNYKDTIKKMAKEINAGESAVGRIYNKLTGADKIQAELKYDEMQKRAKSK